MRALLVPLVLLAGCVAAEPEAPATPTPEVCFDCRECGATSDCAAPEAERVIRTTPVSARGDVGTMACPPVGGSHCLVAQQPTWEGAEFGGGLPRALVGNLTWSASTPSTEEFYLSLLVDMGEGWTWDPAREPGLTGASPLAIDWNLSAYPPATTFHLYVETGAAAGPAWVQPSQAFAFEGLYASAAPAS